MKSKRLFIPCFLLLLNSLIFSNQKIREKDLPQKYQEWLKLVSYIILPVEKDVFIKLTSDRDRDIFIETFWKQRDPTPGTPQNEYRDEHAKRFLYANSYYRRGSPREGWMTDMGRMRILLGPPASIERFDGVAGVHPAQVWYFYGDKSKGLPSYFSVVFYQRGGSGEYKLYNPAADGPTSLLVDTKGIDISDYQKIHEKIKDLAPTLAGPSVTMIPGQYPYNFQPSPQSNIILAEIFESPKKNVSPSYATHFLNYKGIVSTDYLTNYVESEADVALVHDPILDINFLHFSLSPKSISIDYYEQRDQYYCNFKTSVTLRKGEDIVFQYTKDFPFYFPPDKVENIRNNGISIQDSFPLIEGKYGLTVLLQNSVGKEFSIAEKEVFIPEDRDSPKIVGPVMGYKLQDHKNNTNVPFKVGDKQLLIDPKGTFSRGDDVAFFFNLMNVSEVLWKEGRVDTVIKGFKRRDQIFKSFFFRLKDHPYNRILGFSASLPARDFEPDYYEIWLNLKDGKGVVIDEKKSQFIISPEEAVPHPVTLAKSFPLENNFLYFYSLAYQYEKAGDFQKSEANFKKAYDLRPDYKEGIIEHANFLLKVKKFDKVLELIEKVKDDERLKFDYYLVRGKALMGRSEYQEAINNFIEGNKIYNSDTRLLNSLGFCYYRIGQKKNALSVLNASLRLNPEQKEVKELIARIEKEL